MILHFILSSLYPECKSSDKEENRYHKRTQFPERGVDFNQESSNFEPMHLEWTAKLMFWILDQDKIGAFD